VTHHAPLKSSLLSEPKEPSGITASHFQCGDALRTAKAAAGAELRKPRTKAGRAQATRFASDANMLEDVVENNGQHKSHNDAEYPGASCAVRRYNWGMAIVPSTDVVRTWIRHSPTNYATISRARISQRLYPFLCRSTSRAVLSRRSTASEPVETPQPKGLGQSCNTVPTLGIDTKPATPAARATRSNQKRQ